jgi:GNAT superfamily N-acetyltransferase
VLNVRPAAADDAERLHALRETSARWLTDRGIRQWEPGEVSLATVRAQAAAGEWFLDREDGQLRAALRFLWSDPEIWGADAGRAGYVHGLMVDRAYAGVGLGAALLA